MLAHLDDLGGGMGHDVGVLGCEGDDDVLGTRKDDGDRRILRYRLGNALENNAGGIVTTLRIYDDLDFIHAHRPASQTVFLRIKK